MNPERWARVQQVYQSARLQAAPAATKPGKSVRPAVFAVAVLAVIALAVTGWSWLGRQRNAEPETPLTAVPLTSYPGRENIPSFSPDDNSVALEWSLEEPGANGGIYVKQIGAEPPSRLTSDPAADSCPAWSPDGRFIAFLRKRPTVDAAPRIIREHGGQGKMLVESVVPLRSDFLDPELIPYLAWPFSGRSMILWAAT